MTYKHIQKPYLIQRCEQQPYREGMRVGEWLKLDYMGSAEFEWGAFPKALREFWAKSRVKGGVALQHVNVKGTELYLLCSKAAADEYVDWLKDFKAGKERTKEVVSIRNLLTGEPRFGYTKDDFWFDIENAIPIGTTVDAMNKWMKAVAKSIKYMDAQEKETK